MDLSLRNGQTPYRSFENRVKYNTPSSQKSPLATEHAFRFEDQTGPSLVTEKVFISLISRK